MRIGCTMKSHIWFVISLKLKFENMNRNLYFKVIKAIILGKTFYRSGVPHTLVNKKLWDELKTEMREGYSIDLPNGVE